MGKRETQRWLKLIQRAPLIKVILHVTLNNFYDMGEK